MTSPDPGQVTRILTELGGGDRVAAGKLLPLVYEELRALAAVRMGNEASGQTLDPTALVHEAYLRLVGDDQAGATWENRGHFFAAAAEAMRRSLIDHARRRAAAKHGGGLQRKPMDHVELEHTIGPDPVDLLDLNEALDAFESEEPDKASLVKLRFFVGMTGLEAAEALGISTTTAERHWAYARAWLFDRMHGDDRE